MTEILELETRRKIFELIVANVGINVNTISEKLRLSSQLVEYHLRYLEKKELISIIKEGGYKRCFTIGGVGVPDRRVLSLLWQDIPLKIVMFLLYHPFSRHGDILDSLGISSPRVSYHLRKLINHNIIEKVTRGNKSGYVVCDEKYIMKLLIQHRPTLILQTVKDIWDDFGPQPKK